MLMTCPDCGARHHDKLPVKIQGHDLVFGSGKRVTLWPTQIEMLEVLMRRYPNAVSKDALMAALYDHKEDTAGPRILPVLACHIRRKIEDTPLWLVTHWGFGYALQWSENDPGCRSAIDN